MTLALDGGGWSLPGPDPFTPWERPGAHCTGGLGGPRGWSGWVRKILLQWVGTVNHPFGTMWIFLSVPDSCEQWDCTVLWLQSCQFSVLLFMYINCLVVRWYWSSLRVVSVLTAAWRLTFRHRVSCILGQAFHYAPENAFYIFNQQIYFIIWYLLDLASLI